MNAKSGKKPEVKPVVTTAQTKPAEVKPAETKEAEVKPAETKTLEAKAAEVKAAASAVEAKATEKLANVKETVKETTEASSFFPSAYSITLVQKEKSSGKKEEIG